MKKSCVALLAFTLTSVAALAAANAADMYVAPAAGPGGYKDAPWAPTWAGFYAGVNGGGAFDDKSGHITFIDTTVPVHFTLAKSFDASGGFGGGQIGYNWQGMWHPHLVLGVEADIQAADIRDKFSGSTVSGGFSDIWAGKTEINWFGTVRGRLGYSFGQTLLYGTGGLAFGEVKHSLVRTSSPGVPAFGSDSDTRTGWAAGGGAEYMFSPAWSAKVEYQFIDLGTTVATGIDSPGFPTHTNHLDNNFSTVRAGLNYHIGSGYVPLK